MPDLTDSCLAIYWQSGEALIDDRCRMQAVLSFVAHHIRQFASTDPTVNPVDHIADQLLTDAGFVRTAAPQPEPPLPVAITDAR